MLHEPSSKRIQSASFVYRYCELVYHWRWWIIVGYLVLAGIAAWQVTHLRSTTDNRVFFGPENPELVALETLERTYSENNDVLIAVAPRDGNVFAPKVLQTIRQLTDSLWKVPYATRVDSIANYQHSYADRDEIVIRDLVPADFSYTSEAIAEARSIALAEPALKGLLISQKADVAGVAVNFKMPRDKPESLEKVVAYLAALRQDVEKADPSVTLHLTGNVMLMHAFGEAHRRDMITLVPLMMVVMAVILFVLIRSWTATAIALFVSVLATFFSMGFAGATGIVMNAGSGPAPFIVLTVSVAYAVHLITQFLDDRRLGASNRVAVINIVEGHGFPIFLAGLTTAIGFLSLNASDAPPFHDLGNISALGVAVAFAISFTLLPALLHVVPIKINPVKRTMDAAMKSLSGLVVRRPLRFLLASGALVAALGFGVTRIDQSENWIKYFDESFQFRRDTDFVVKNLTGFDIIEFSIPAKGENGIEDPEYLRKLDAFTQWLRSQPEVSNVISISDVVKRIHRNMHGDDKAYDRVPADRKEVAQYFLLYELSLPNGLSLTDRISVSRSATRLTVVARKDGKNLPSDQLIPLTERMESWLRAHGDSAAAKGTGLSLVFARLSSRNIEMMLGGTGLAVLIVSVILIAGLRSFKLGVVSLSADLIPALMSFGLWGYAIGQINVAVSVVAAMTFGVVVDDTIHYLAKYAKARRTLGMTPAQAVEFAFTSVGKAMIFTTVIMSAGFLVLATSSFGVNSSLGILTAATFIWAVIADLSLLAPLLLVCDRDFKLFDWQQVKSAKYGAEPASVHRRVDAYFDRIRDGHVVVGRVPGADAVELWSNDYLSLGGHPSIVKAQTAALRNGDNDLYMSAAFLNDTSPQRALERRMAAFVRAEAAVLCQSGWCANAGLIQVLADPHTPVYLDQFAHASLWEGARASAAPTHAFRHNDAASLEKQLLDHGPGVVAVDAIYSADGTIAPLAEIAALCERFGCVLVTDESHSIGVCGPKGEGLVPALGLTGKVHYRTFSLSKAFVTRAGMVAGPARVMSYFPYEARPVIFSSAVLPHEVERLAATLQVVQDEDWRRQQLRQNTQFLRHGLNKLGYAVDLESSQVIALHSGSERQTVALRDLLEERGIFGAVFCAPATPKNHALVRLSVNAGLSLDDMNRVLDTCKHIVDTRPITPWPKHLLWPNVSNADRMAEKRDAVAVHGDAIPALS